MFDKMTKIIRLCARQDYTEKVSNIRIMGALPIAIGIGADGESRCSLGLVRALMNLV